MLKRDFVEYAINVALDHILGRLRHKKKHNQLSEDVQKHVDEALERLRCGDAEGALESFDAAIRLDPKHLGIRIRKLKLEYRHDPIEALVSVGVISASTTDKKTLAKVYDLKAAACTTLLADFKEESKIKLVNSMINYADQAIDYDNSIVTYYWNRAESKVLLGNLYSRDSRFDEAIKEYNSAISDINRVITFGEDCDKLAIQVWTSFIDDSIWFPDTSEWNYLKSALIRIRQVHDEYVEVSSPSDIVPTKLNLSKVALNILVPIMITLVSIAFSSPVENQSTVYHNNNPYTSSQIESNSIEQKATISIEDELESMMNEITDDSESVVIFDEKLESRVDLPDEYLKNKEAPIKNFVILARVDLPDEWLT